MTPRYVLRRAAFSVLSFYAVVTLVFVAVVTVPDPAPAVLNYYNVNADQIPALIAAKGGNIPVWERYVDFLRRFLTFNWGRSVTRYGELGPPVTSLLRRGATYTLAYAVPGVVAGFVGGVALGVYAAVEKGGYVDRAVRSVGYLTFGIPNLFLAEIALFALTVQFELVEFSLGTSEGKIYSTGAPIDLFTTDALVQFGVIATILAVGLAGGQVRYARSECLEYVSADFVKLARAKGASKLRVMAHVFRNAALPLLATFLDDLVSVLLVHVFVLEFVFDIPGLGQLGLVAVKARDVSTTMGIVILMVTGGIVVNFLQDVGAGAVDPRVETE